MKEIDQQVRDSIKSIINKRVVAMKAGETSHDDLLGILLDSNYKEIKECGNNKFGLSIDEVIEECKLFYFAGQETTGNMLVWTMILLGQHLEWQTRARQEVLHIFRDKKPDIDGLSHLKVINTIFNEVLRLYSPAVLLRRQIHEETKLGVVAIFLFYIIWRISNWLWIEPKRIEKFLKDQGLKGTSYRFMYGDLKEMVRMMNEAKSKPMNLTHDIAFRVSPFFHKSLNTLGKSCFTWMETSHDDLLDILLDSNYKEIKEHGNCNFGLSIDEVIEECKLFYFAGQETTGNMLVWTMILLGLYSEWQTRARQEVLHVFGDKNPDIDGLSHLKVISIIFREVLRLYSPAILLRRLIHEKTKLGNLTLPAGTLVQINTFILHHDKDMWGEDVNEFKPKRFSKGVSRVTKGKATYLPFGGGPRICIGKNFAILEAKMALAMILQYFSFELSPSYSHAPHAMPTLQPQLGAHLIMHKI
ncbi:hypothetical protein L1987_79002 [Smallanthus sonchifolius]|uniref:Uncharacterized protein n=1 Tax=Smallanthus sonchifolius TaxID=185202 RepID=A0ACB8ZFB6_9ASTR|nr:hypothetical protein L1987_79002 [Smallanthus sonchifolius]